MKRTDFSIIIPYFNHGKFIEETINSLVAQTIGFHNLEVFIINDVSTDSFSITQLSKIKKEFPQIKIIENKKNEGPAFSRNKAAKLAKSDFFIFLDADDKIDSTFCEKMRIVLLREKEITFAYSFIQHFGKNNDVYETWNPYDFSAEIFENKLPYCAAIRRKAFQKVGGFDESLQSFESEDWDFWIRMGKNNFHGICLPEPLFFYRQHENLRLKEVQKNYSKVVKALRKRHRDVFCFWNVFFLRQKWAKRTKKPLKISLIRNFHKWPKWFQNIAIKFYEAELTNFNNWKKSPKKCFQLIIPIYLRKNLNKKFGKEVFIEKTKFSDFFPQDDFISTITFTKDSSLQSEKRETIVFILPWLPLGGIEILFRQIFSKFCHKFHFLIFTTQTDKNVFHSEIAPFATIFHLPNLFKKPAEQSDFVIQKIKKFKVKKVFIVNSFVGFQWIPQIKTVFPNLLFFTILHGYLKNGWDFLNATEMYFPFFEKIICVSEDVKKEFQKRLKINGIKNFDKIKCIENTVDFERLDNLSQKSHSLISELKKPSKAQKNIVFLGRYNWEKNPHFFLDIANFFVTTLKLKNYKFFMFGEGSQKEELILRAKKINKIAKEKMVFIGEKQDNIAAIFNCADVSVNCSPNEGFGLAVCESIYFGVPVVGFGIDIFTRFVPSEIFFSVPEKAKYRVEIFAQKIFMATENEKSILQKNNSKKWVEENFSAKDFFEKYEEVFSERSE
jgi:glycosyltransferase involved in cell wall biosynthesis